MHKDTNHETGPFLWGLMLGAVMGGIFGVLKASRPGEDSRSLIKKKVHKAGSTLQQSADNVLFRTGVVLGRVKGAVEVVKRHMARGFGQQRAVINHSGEGE